MNNKKVSVVISNYNGRELLNSNLPNVLKACEGCEVIVVDDASNDESVEFIKKNFPEVKLIVNQKNLRYAKTCNKGVKAAKGNIVILLNNDVSPHPDFLKPLIKEMEDKNVFAVGCLEKAKYNNKEIVSGRSEAKISKGLLIHWRAKEQTKKDTFWVAGGSGAFNKQKYLKLGGFDPIYSPAYWEDIDLSYRARKKGWKTKFAPDSKVNHNHETTNLSEFGRQKIEFYSYRNGLIFCWKNFAGINLLKHFLWLPYHLVVKGIQTKGLFIKAFLAGIIRVITYNKRENN